MIETHFCGIRGCGKPAHQQLDQSFGNVVLRIWVCQQHETKPEQSGVLEIDHSRTVWLLKGAV